MHKSCGNLDCKVSTAIDDETLTFGSGKLDEFGFFEHPCLICAANWKKHNPTDKVWPTANKETQCVSKNIHVYFAKMLDGNTHI